MLFDKIVRSLEGVDYVVVEHKATPTSEESALARGESMKIGAKALLVKVKQGFVLCVFPADRRLDTKKFKKLFGKKLRFASPEELKKVTGCEKGAVPPFGSLLGVEMIVDTALFEEEYMAFNAGDLCKSIKMKTKDYKMIVKPKLEEFSEYL